MLIKRIANATHNWGAPKDWDGELNGKCGVLPARLVETNAGPMYESAWELTPEELEVVKAGGSIHLFISAHPHPVVAMSVQKLEEDG